MTAYDLTEFFKLSSVINYNLSAASLNRHNLLLYILGGKRLDASQQADKEKKELMVEALGYLFSAYSNKRRRLGPLAVLHPLRATALMTRAKEVPEMSGLLSVLFHDILEDVKSVDFEDRQWQDMEERLFQMLEHMAPDEEFQLIQRLKALTRTKSESYYRYIGRMLECADTFPDVVEVKLADRLDNTLDMRIDLEDPIAGIDCFESIFQMLFVCNYPGYVPRTEHPPTTAMNGARRLQQLYKNALLLSLIRQKPLNKETPARHTLFNAVAEASLKEAQRTFMHLIGYHFTNTAAQRALILDAMEYCHCGRSDLVTLPDGNRMLDGLFTTYFAPTDRRVLKERLERLYENKPLMIQASIAFIVIFLGFLNDPDYFVQGISTEGITAA